MTSGPSLRIQKEVAIEVLKEGTKLRLPSSLLPNHLISPPERLIGEAPILLRSAGLMASHIFGLGSRLLNLEHFFAMLN